MPSCIQTSDETLSEPKAIANEFNTYFTSIADSLKNNKFDGNKSFRGYLDAPLMNSFVLYNCDEKEISTIISGLNQNKASGLNSIPPKILSILKYDIPKPLCMIFNLSFCTGIHPDILRIAKTIPVFKKGSRLQVSNYRPISLLSNINKILENSFTLDYTSFSVIIIASTIYHLVFGQNILLIMLINITESILHELDNQEFACGVFVDFQKAFDTVNHDILTEKLKYYGGRGVANYWSKSYLSIRSNLYLF